MTNKPRKPGRPPLPPGERRGVAVLIDMREDEREALRAKAEAAGKPLAAWAREVLLRAARR